LVSNLEAKVAHSSMGIDETRVSGLVTKLSVTENSDGEFGRKTQHGKEYTIQSLDKEQ
jgi:hypothetical protein